MPERKVRITIVDNAGDRPGERSCSGECGTDWSKPEAMSQAQQKVREKFGNRAALNYVDLPQAKDTPSIRKIKESVQGMPFPVLLANGRPRIAGEFDLRQLVDVIEADLEAEI